MIIRKIAEAMRTQDWFTVFIEFVIVVAGIFVGLQVDDWNQFRLDRVQERESLERLLDESEQVIKYVEYQLDEGADRVYAQRQLVETMFSEGPLPDDTSSAEWGFISLDFYPSMAPVRMAYDELASTGGIRLIRSTDVRDALSLYYAELDWYLAQQSYFRDFSIAAGNEPELAAIEHVQAVYDAEHELGRGYVFDWPGLRSDRKLGSLFVSKLRSQIVMNKNRQQLLERAQAMCDVIAREIGEECVPESGQD